MLNFRSCKFAWTVVLSIAANSTVIAQDSGTVPATPIAPGKAIETAPPAPVEATLKVGDQAPPLVIEKWVKGDPVAAFEPGKVYVVEFWATWCGPCIKGMPHLSELQREYGPRGVTVIGCTSAGKNNSFEAVDEMVKAKGDGMAYTVAWDKERTTNTAYMTASNQRGIPTSFVVDQTGTLVWIGHPIHLEFVLDPLLSGKWDVKTGPEAVQATIQEASTLVGGVRTKARENPAEALTDWATLESKFPRVARQMPDLKLDLMYASGKIEEGDKLAQSIFDSAVRARSAGDLLSIVRTITNPDRKIEKPSLDLALKAAEKAAEFGNATSPMYPESIARVHFLRGDAIRAVEFQTRAVALAPANQKSRLEQTLVDYKKKAEGRE